MSALPFLSFLLLPPIVVLCCLFYLFFFTLFPLLIYLFIPLQSISAPAETLSCVESLCCFQHGQSGCTRLAHFLEQMTGQCQDSVNHCQVSSRSNRWERLQLALTLNLIRWFENLEIRPECSSP